jgi:hypothetical protein
MADLLAVAPVLSLSRRIDECVLAGQFLVSHSLSSHAVQQADESRGIIGFAIVKSVSLFIELAEQMEGFDTYIRPLQAAL